MSKENDGKLRRVLDGIRRDCKNEHTTWVSGATVNDHPADAEQNGQNSSTQDSFESLGEEIQIARSRLQDIDQLPQSNTNNLKKIMFVKMYDLLAEVIELDSDFASILDPKALEPLHRQRLDVHYLQLTQGEQISLINFLSDVNRWAEQAVGTEAGPEHERKPSPEPEASSEQQQAPLPTYDEESLPSQIQKPGSPWYSPTSPTCEPVSHIYHPASSSFADQQDIKTAADWCCPSRYDKPSPPPRVALSEQHDSWSSIPEYDSEETRKLEYYMDPVINSPSERPRAEIVTIKQEVRKTPIRKRLGELIDGQGASQLRSTSHHLLSPVRATLRRTRTRVRNISVATHIGTSDDTIAEALTWLQPPSPSRARRWGKQALDGEATFIRSDSRGD